MSIAQFHAYVRDAGQPGPPPAASRSWGIECEREGLTRGRAGSGTYHTAVLAPGHGSRFQVLWPAGRRPGSRFYGRPEAGFQVLVTSMAGQKRPGSRSTVLSLTPGQSTFAVLLKRRACGLLQEIGRKHRRMSALLRMEAMQADNAAAAAARDAAFMARQQQRHTAREQQLADAESRAEVRRKGKRKATS